MSAQRVRTRRRTILAWVPTAIVALLCVGVVVATIAVQNSWWTSPGSPPSSDQRAPDGMSRFDRAGQDYFTRDGLVRVRVSAESLPASELGLEPDSTTVVQPLVPVSAVVLGDDGAFTVDLVKTIAITTAGDRVASVALVQDGSGMWPVMYAELKRVAPSWGWTPEQLDQLQTDLTTASRNADGASYSATVSEVEHKGALSSAEITIDPHGGNTALTFIIRSLLN